MGSFLLHVLAVIGAIVVALVAAVVALVVTRSIKVRVVRAEPFPNADLPGIDPVTYKALHDDIKAFEAGERP